MNHLAGVRVLDLSRILAGPFCCQVLADLGADVVKVERPGTGDDTRQWGPPFVGENTSAYFLSTNRGKRSVALELGQPDAQRVLDDLIRQADVLVENFLPSALRKFGLEPARLRALNPRLVCCSISGFGRTGPLADTPGYDLVVQATSGLMAITGEPEGVPMKVGVAISDVITGLFTAISALAGLWSRQQSGEGTSFDLSLADCTLAGLVNVAQSALVTGQPPRRWGNAHPNIVPYEAFATADGHLVLAVGNDRQWQRFCQAVGKGEWATDERFATNPARVEHRDTLHTLVATLLATRTTDDWLSLCAAAQVPAAPVMNLQQVLGSALVAARQMVTAATVGEPGVHLVASPIQDGSAQRAAPRRPPDVGEHTDEVLADWLGYATGEIDELRSRGAFG